MVNEYKKVPLIKTKRQRRRVMASLYIYLSREVKKRKDYEEKQGKQNDKQCLNYYVDGMRIFYEKGMFYIRLNDIEDPIPDVISDIVVGFSSRDLISLEPKREIGFYKLKTAIATVDIQGNYIDVRINAKKIEHLKELYYKIREGTILPSKSWKGEQTSQKTKEKKKKSLYIRFRDFMLP